MKALINSNKVLVKNGDVVTMDDSSTALTGTITPTDGATSITIQTGRQCSFFAIFLTTPNSSFTHRLGSLCSVGIEPKAGALNRWRATYGTGYSLTEGGGTVTYNANNIVISSATYPFAGALYRWVAW